MLNYVCLAGYHARNQDRAVRQLDVFPYFPLMLMPGIRALNSVSAAVDLENQVSDCPERDIVRMRTGPGPPANVLPDLLAWNVAESVIERFHSLLGFPHVCRELIIRIRGPDLAERRIIELQYDPCLRNCLIFLAQ